MNYHPATLARMDLCGFGEDRGREGRKRVAPDKPQHWQTHTPEKKPVPDPGSVQVEVVCQRHAVGVRFQFGANRLRHDVMQVKVPGWTNGLGWCVETKMYMNCDRNDSTKVTCPSPDFLKLLCHACEESSWCSHWFLSDRQGKNIPCSSDPARDDYIDYLSVPFQIREDTPEPISPLFEPEFNCDDVRRDLKKIMKVPRLQYDLRTRIVEIVTSLCDELGAYDRGDINCDRHEGRRHQGHPHIGPVKWTEPENVQ